MVDAQSAALTRNKNKLSLAALLMSSETSLPYPAIPGYRIERVLGEGGMAKVYLAIQENFEREVALKVMSTSLNNDPSFSERFLREARIVAKLMHPHIVTVYDVGVHEGFHYLAMQYIPGEELKEIYRSLPLASALDVVKDVAQALHFAAGKGYVHRDVKPENILIHGETGRAVLMDFGIARAVDCVSSNVTRTGTIIGTPQYMSPEQAKGEAVGHAGDLYSLGVVLYLVLCGRVPFTADSGMAVGIKHITETPAPLPKGMEAFQSIINKLLAKNPTKRFSTGNALVEALNAISDEEVLKADSIRRHSETDVLTASTGAKTIVNSSATVVTRAGDDHDTEVDQGTEMIFRPDKLKKPEAAKQAEQKQSDPKQEEQKKYSTPHIPEEDRRPVEGEEETRKSNGVRWITALAILTGAGFFSWEKQKELGLESTFTRLSEESQPLLQDLGISQKKAQGAASPVTAVTESKMGEQTDRPSGLVRNTEANHGEASENVTAGLRDDEVGVADTEAIVLETSSTTVVDDLLAQVTEEDPLLKLEAAADLEPLEIPALVSTYRQLIDAEPERSEQIKAALDERQTQLLNSVEESLRVKDWVASQQRYAALLDAFPDIAQVQPVDTTVINKEAVGEVPSGERQSSSRFERMAEAVATGEKIQSLLAEAEKYFSVNALAVPAGANAMESYQAVLALQADNSEAQAGLNAIAKRYEELMGKAIADKQWKKARRYHERGLLAAPDSQAFIDLGARQKNEKQKHDKKIAAEKKRQADIASLLQQAKAFLSEGFLIPSALDSGKGVVSAWQAYQGVVMLDSAHSSAKAGLKEVKMGVFERVNQLMVSEETLPQASLYLQQALAAFASEDAITQSTLERLQEVLAEKVFEASKPKVLRVQISAAPLVELSDSSANTLPADRVIYIGFEFKNFEQDTTVLQAILYDGSGSVKIAQVPVITQGATGQQYFDISRPVEGFANGGYTVELLKGVEVLASTRFLVEK